MSDTSLFSGSDSGVAIPKEWFAVIGQDRISGPGYTMWRDWDEADWVDAIIRYDSYNGGEETSPAVAAKGDQLGISRAECVESP